jgi:hypothetical protein
MTARAGLDHRWRNFIRRQVDPSEREAGCYGRGRFPLFDLLPNGHLTSGRVRSSIEHTFDPVARSLPDRRRIPGPPQPSIDRGIRFVGAETGFRRRGPKGPRPAARPRRHSGLFGPPIRCRSVGWEAQVTKRYDEPIDVTADSAEPTAPIAFSWRGRRYDIDQRLESWLEATETYNGGGGRDREYFRVLAHPTGALASGDLDADGFLCSTGAVYDVYRDRIRGRWLLARIWD